MASDFIASDTTIQAKWPFTLMLVFRLIMRPLPITTRQSIWRLILVIWEMKVGACLSTGVSFDPGLSERFIGPQLWLALFIPCNVTVLRCHKMFYDQDTSER